MLRRHILGLSFALTFLTFSFSYAQQDKEQYQNIVEQVKASFNLNQPEKIYALTSEVFRKKMTGEQFAVGMSKFHAKTGDWLSSDFKEENEKGLDYLSVFENSRQVFSIKLNAQGKIDRLNFASAPITIPAKTEQVPSNNPLKDSLDLTVEHLVRPYIQKGNTCGLVLAVVRNGKVRKYSYGSVNKAGSQLPDAEQTIFEIGSVTKTFNALLLARQVVAGRMKLDDPVNLYLPDSIPALNFQGRPITLQDLANHTSGFPRLPANIFNAKVDPKDPYKHYLPDSLYSFLKHYRATVMPGTVFSYSNFGAGVLGTILERKLGSSFETLIVNRICKPLGMLHTSVTLNNAAQQNFAQGYNESGVATAPWDLASLKGSGAIRSTLNDMVKYARAQMEIKGPLGKAILLSHQQTFSSKAQTMALGWRINHSGQHTYLHHSGGTGGFRSFVGFDPDRQTAIVILSNAAEDVTAIGESFLK
ncbi:serine hydrolase domain-containing protein [Pedobacter africanus]|uniref:CubicO group peptidase, beta-lactamase class C family n=1 Tax=Pedobacter africanus TaxID=151894 RepID=A0A1W2B130_9SPHI|nr:serine hydrolase domain-containing protein [Pedobacter africanus]SMC66108.1 CubicO group peptidase, beta-lactamase class C family [Pedobacter africanus]